MIPIFRRRQSGLAQRNFAEDNDRFHHLTGSAARIAQRTYGGVCDIPGEEASFNFRKALDEFDRSLIHHSPAELSGRSNNTIRDERLGTALDGLPEFDLAVAESSTPRREVDADAKTRASRANMAAAPEEFARAVNGLELQLRNVIEQLAVFHQPGRIDVAMFELRKDLSEICRVLNEAMPRRAIEVLEKEVRTLAERVDSSRGRLVGSVGRHESPRRRPLRRGRKPTINLVCIKSCITLDTRFSTGGTFEAKLNVQKIFVHQSGRLLSVMQSHQIDGLLPLCGFNATPIHFFHKLVQSEISRRISVAYH